MLTGLALIGVVLALGREPMLLAIGDYLVVQDELQPADVIHVIAGPDHRADYGIQLYREGYGRCIFFTGDWCAKHQCIHAERAAERALEQGVPAAAIAADPSSVTSTYAELALLRAYTARSPAPVRSVIVVSDPFHMRRAQWAARQVLDPAISVQVSPVPFDLTPYQRRWWTDPPSARYVRDEYEKMAYYLARYGLNWRPLSEWLATLDAE